MTRATKAALACQGACSSLRENSHHEKAHLVPPLPHTLDHEEPTNLQKIYYHCASLVIYLSNRPSQIRNEDILVD